jgi:hypothetical protein
MPAVTGIAGDGAWAAAGAFSGPRPSRQITTAATSAAITTAPIARLTIASASLALKQREDR